MARQQLSCGRAGCSEPDHVMRTCAFSRSPKFEQPKKSLNFFSWWGFAPPDPPLESAAVAASAGQLRTLKPSRPLSQPPQGGLECRLEYSQAISNQACRFRNFFLNPIAELFFDFIFAKEPGNAKSNVDPADPTLSHGFLGNV